MRFELTDSKLTRVKKLLRGSLGRPIHSGLSPSSLRSPVRIGIHEFHYQGKAGSRGKVLLGRFVCGHCGEERIMGVSWDSGFNDK